MSLKFENGTTHNFIHLLKRQTPFERLGTLSYSPSIVTMAVSLAISEIFSIKEWLDLEIWVWVVQGHIKWHGSIDHVRLSIGPPL